MLKVVEKLRESEWKSLWESCGRIYTFLTDGWDDGGMLWEKLGFTHSFGEISTEISTRKMGYFPDMKGVDLHIYT